MEEEEEATNSHQRSTSTTETTIMAALSALTPPQLSDLSASFSSVFRRHDRRLSTLLSSPILFSLTLRHLRSLSLPQKFLLIAKLLLSLLSHLTNFLRLRTSDSSGFAASMRLSDLDAVLLLFLLCEFHRHYPESLISSPSRWRLVLCDYLSNNVLNNLSGVGVSDGEILTAYVQAVAKCRRLVCSAYVGGRREKAASVAAVVALPSVEASGVGTECAICREEMNRGREVCELPCRHQFHWICILPWLRKRSTCPCCRHRLPTDDVFGEVARLWEFLVNFTDGN